MTLFLPGPATERAEAWREVAKRAFAAGIEKVEAEAQRLAVVRYSTDLRSLPTKDRVKLVAEATETVERAKVKP